MILEHFQSIIEKITGQEPKTESQEEIPEKIYHGFELPINYTPLEYIHKLSPIVSSDLELIPYQKNNDEIPCSQQNLPLDRPNSSGDPRSPTELSQCAQSNVGGVNTPSEPPKVVQGCEQSSLTRPKCMYEYLLKPKHDFAYNMISEWNQQYTTYTPFLNDSQTMIKNTPEYHNSLDKLTVNPYIFDQDKCDKIMEIWQDTKEDPSFLEKYCYIEWDMLKQFNESSYFLQVMTVLNMTSPIMSFIIPILFFIFPFLLLKLRGIPISFSVYVQVLKEIAQHHFIGKSIGAFQSMSWDKVIYVLITLGLYMMQIYQNINTCVRFYKNMHRINSHLIEMRHYLAYSINSMTAFNEVNEKLPSYRNFNMITAQHRAKLQELCAQLECIKPFKPSIFKITEIGYMLKCFYRLHDNTDYEKSIRYSIGFEGFINNICGVHENMHDKHVSVAKFNDNLATNLTQQYYPPYVQSKHVKNNFDLTNNAIITGPNAAGKTTMLKTTTINIIFTQQFGCGFYQDCVLRPYTHIHSYLNIPDTSGRDSLFQAESRRCKEIIDIICDTTVGTHHFCIFDELYSGTNPIEATQAAYAFLLYLSKYKHVDFILTTHYTELCKRLEKNVNNEIDNSNNADNVIPTPRKSVQNYKMNILKNPETGEIKYTYALKPGISKVKGAILILQEMKYPEEIINEMRKRKPPKCAAKIVQQDL